MFNEGVYYFVLFSSVIPVLVLIITKRMLYINDVYVQLICFRFLTDILCFCFEYYLHNSNPLFHFTLPINFYLIFKVFSREYRFQKIHMFLFTLILLVFVIEIFPNSIFGTVSYLNLVTNFLISALGCFVIYKVELNRVLNHVVFPITIYYSILFFYSLFQAQIDHSTQLYSSLFIVLASSTLFLNLILSRGLWLMKVK